MRHTRLLAIILGGCLLFGSLIALPPGAVATTSELDPTVEPPPPPPPPPVIPTARPTATPEPTGTGLRGDYFNGTDFTEHVFTRTDQQIAFNWGTAAPGAGVNRDKFSVRWTGDLKPPLDGTFHFTAFADNGVRVWVNQQRIIDSWGNRGPRTVAGKISGLQANQRVRITVEYQEYWGGAGITLYWEHPAFKRQVVPQSALYPAP